MKLGDRVRDRYTGFQGILVARTEWLYGCTRVGIECSDLKDGKPIEPQWFDEQRVELVASLDKFESEQSSATSGGPRTVPQRRADPC